MYFKAEEEISEILITVWKRKDKNEQWEIFYENSNQVLREIFTNFGITGLSGKLKSNLLDNIKTRRIPEIKSRIIQAENIQQTYFKLSFQNYHPINLTLGCQPLMKYEVSPEAFFPSLQEAIFSPEIGNKLTKVF